METNINGTESIVKCIFCGSNMMKYNDKASVCYKCLNKKCGYIFCERL